VLRPDRRQLTVTLRKAEALHVRVVEADGKPAPGAVVWVAGGQLWPPRAIVADHGGVATIAGLRQGAYDFRAQYASSVSPVAFGVRLPETLARGLELVVAPGRSVQLDVKDASGGAGVAAANAVIAEDGLSSFPIQGRTDEAGHLTLGPLGTGVLTVSVTAEGFVAKEGVPIAAGAAAPVSVEVRLLRGATVLGKVVDALGVGVEGATLELVGNDLDGQPLSRVGGSRRVSYGFFERALSAPLALAPPGELGVMLGPWRQGH
jgi:hypothetical protein